MYSFVTILNNTALYTCKLLKKKKKANQQCSQHTHIKVVTMWGEVCVNYLDYGNHFTLYRCIKLPHLYSLNVHNFMHQLYFSKAGKNKIKTVALGSLLSFSPVSSLFF